ncbi:unnamed protein product [Albugo candida]|uniref:Uncharacterized protein n=1 Tax=Albugo candida TaxID=65357 RepID=A0A024G8F2_9STRA|nr:unnamed protein product [Albugo candida]|eukprot:CCI42914.1 unnamed protein product [Albugo candida]
MTPISICMTARKHSFGRFENQIDAAEPRNGFPAFEACIKKTRLYYKQFTCEPRVIITCHIFIKLPAKYTFALNVDSITSAPVLSYSQLSTMIPSLLPKDVIQDRKVAVSFL